MMILLFLVIAFILVFSIRLEIWMMHRDRARSEILRLEDQSVRDWTEGMYVETDSFVSDIFSFKFTFEEFYPGLLSFIEEQEVYNENFKQST